MELPIPLDESSPVCKEVQRYEMWPSNRSYRGGTIPTYKVFAVGVIGGAVTIAAATSAVDSRTDTLAKVLTARNQLECAPYRIQDTGSMY